MRVMVEGKWYEAKAGLPIVVQLTGQDKLNIANMLPDATMYAIFASGEEMTDKEKFDWMKKKKEQ